MVINLGFEDSTINANDEVTIVNENSDTTTLPTTNNTNNTLQRANTIPGSSNSNLNKNDNNQLSTEPSEITELKKFLLNYL